MAHSGLIHRFPVLSGSEINTPTFLDGEQDGTDPDSFSPAWSDNTVSGTVNVDYAYDTSGGKSRCRDLGTATNSQFILASPDDTSDTHEDAFWILRGATAVAGTGGPGNAGNYLFNTYRDASNVNSAGLYDNFSGNWQWLGDTATFATTGKAVTGTYDLWVYIVGGIVAYWFDDETKPNAQDAAFDQALTSQGRMVFRDLNAGTSDTTALLFTDLLYGHLD